MPTDNELDRLAAMGNALRADWPVRSLRTHLAKNHATRAYRDLAVALAWIAADPQTQTPARLIEAGPWWKATAVDAPTVTHPVVHCPEHRQHRAWNCPDCEAQSAVNPHEHAERVRQVLRESRKP